MMLSDVCLSDVCCVHLVGGHRVLPAGWMVRIDWSGPARLAWLKAAAARFRCRPGRGHIVAAARLQLVWVWPPICTCGYLWVPVCLGLVSNLLSALYSQQQDVNHRHPNLPV